MGIVGAVRALFGGARRESVGAKATRVFAQVEQAIRLDERAADVAAGSFRNEVVLMLRHAEDLDRHRHQIAVAAARDPGLLEQYLVYADWLQARGDPYGELIAIQHEIVARGASPELVEAERRLLVRLKRNPRPWPTWDAG